MESQGTLPCSQGPTTGSWARWIQLTNSIEQSLFWEADSHSASQDPHCMEPQGSLPCSQEPNTGFWARWIHLTNSMEQSPFWEANSHSASQDQYFPPLVANLSQFNSDHTVQPISLRAILTFIWIYKTFLMIQTKSVVIFLTKVMEGTGKGKVPVLN
jgi:hypothetical protein